MANTPPRSSPMKALRRDREAEKEATHARRQIEAVQGRLAEKENSLCYDRSISVLEAEIAKRLERSSGTVAALDGRICKLDQQLLSAASRTRRQPRTPHRLTNPRKAVDDARSSCSAAGAHPKPCSGAHPFNDWLASITRSDYLRTNESHPLSIATNHQPGQCRISSQEPISAAQSLKCKKRTWNLEAMSKTSNACKVHEREFDPGTGSISSANVCGVEMSDPCTEVLAPDLASWPGQRADDFSFHAPDLTRTSHFSSSAPGPEDSQLLSDSRVTVASTQSAVASLGSPKVAANKCTPASPVREMQSAIELHHGGECGHENLRNLVPDDPSNLQEKYVDSKFSEMQAMVRQSIREHSTSQQQTMSSVLERVARLEEEVKTARSEATKAHQECRLVRAAFAGQLRSVKAIKQQREDFEQTQRGELLGVQAELGRLMAIEDCCHLAQELVAEQHSSQSKQIEASVAELQRQVLETATNVSESNASVAGLRSLVKEAMERCDEMQQSTLRQLACHSHESLAREKKILSRCEELQHSMTSMDDRMGRFASHEGLANTPSLQDVRSDILRTLDEVKDNWRSVCTSLSEQMHGTAKTCQRHRVDLTRRADKAFEESKRVEESVKQLQTVMSHILERVERSENEIRCNDDNILHICASIHAIQAGVLSEHGREFAQQNDWRISAIDPNTSTQHSVYSTCGTYFANAKNGDHEVAANTLESLVHSVKTLPASSCSQDPGTAAKTPSIFASPPILAPQGFDALFPEHQHSSCQHRGSLTSQNNVVVNTIGRRQDQEQQTILACSHSPPVPTLQEPSSLRVLYSRRRTDESRDSTLSHGEPIEKDSRDPTEASAKSGSVSATTPERCAPSSTAVVTSTRPVSCHIKLPPTPRLVHFDSAADSSQRRNSDSSEHSGPEEALMSARPGAGVPRGGNGEVV